MFAGSTYSVRSLLQLTADHQGLGKQLGQTLTSHRRMLRSREGRGLQVHPVPCDSQPRASTSQTGSCVRSPGRAPVCAEPPTAGPAHASAFLGAQSMLVLLVSHQTSRSQRLVALAGPHPVPPWRLVPGSTGLCNQGEYTPLRGGKHCKETDPVTELETTED